MKIAKIFLLFLSAFIISFVLLFLQSKSKNPLISPVLGQSREITKANYKWFPQESPKEFPYAPEISAQAAYFIEVNSGEVLFDKDSKAKLRVASLTKIMTAIITLENANFEDKLIVSEKAASMEPDKMFLIPSEVLSVEELLGGLFLISANDAAEVLAERVLNSREKFIELMNLKAKQLGMEDSYFLNPSGLEEDPPAGEAGDDKQLSTAYDIALMSRYAIKHFPKLIQITSNPHIFIPKTDFHQDYDLSSGINLVTTYPGVLGFKTGFTPEAGLTLVTYAKKGEREVLGVLLNAINRRDDARALLDYSFSKLDIK